MPLWVPAAIGGAVLIGGAAAYYKLRTPSFARGVGSVKPGAATLTQAQKFLTSTPGGSVPISQAQKFVTAAKDPFQPDFPGAPVGPPVAVSVQGGWSPVFFHVANAYTLEWGACFYDWHKDLSLEFGDARAIKKMVGTMHRVMDWILTEAPVIGWIVKRVCFRVRMPALKLHVTGPLGSLELIGPALPRGLARELADGTIVRGTGPNASGGITIEGWNPQTSRPGFNAKFGKWPLEWPPPVGKLGAAWLRNMGDRAGIRYDVYQLITSQNGEEKSWPMMTKSGWRGMFRLGGDHTLTAVLDEKGEISNRAAMDLFDEWKPYGHEGLKKKSSTKIKAENRYY